MEEKIDIVKIPRTDKNEDNSRYERKISYIVSDDYGNEATLYRKEIVINKEELIKNKEDLQKRIDDIDQTISAIEVADKLIIQEVSIDTTTSIKKS